MTILGIGTDVVENQRIKNSIKNKKFIKRVFSKKEINLSKKYKNKLNYFSKRFAAKEAFSKALGTGISKGIKFNQIVVLNEKNGKPFIKLIKDTKKKVEKKLKKKNYKISLSLTDEDEYAVAFVTISIWKKKVLLKLL